MAFFVLAAGVSFFLFVPILPHNIIKKPKLPPSVKNSCFAISNSPLPFTQMHLWLHRERNEVVFARP